MADLGVNTTPAFMSKVFESAATVSMPNWNHRLAGTLTVNGTPAKKRVVVATRNGVYLASTFSDATTGAWEITHLPESVASKKLIVLAMDDSETYNAEVADNVQPVA